MSNNVEIIVFGSCFLDYIAYGDRIPNPGETLTSTSFQKGFGGKGANQAVAAARLLPTNKKNNNQISVSMAGCVGADGDGNDYVQNLKDAGCNVSRMKQLKGQSTGIALITVDKNGRNAIVICPNAAGKTSFSNTSNADACVPPHQFTPSSFFSSSSASSGRGIFICQNEIPLPATLESLKAAFMTEKYYTVFNPAPAPSTKEQIQQLLPYLKYIDLITPNEHEAFLMTGVKVTDLKSASKAISVLQKEFGALDVIITMGEHGCAVSSRNSNNNSSQMVPAFRVKAVDTTGAGDCFVGSLSYFLAEAMLKNENSSSSSKFPSSEVLTSACRKANIIAAHSVTKKGTQSSYHTREQLPKSLFEENNNSKL